MLALTAATVALGALLAQATPTEHVAKIERELAARGESHSVRLINNCGQGQAVWQDQTGTVRSDPYYTSSGPIEGGLAWIKGGSYGCGDANAIGCGDVEFTLVNPDNKDGKGTQNAFNYSFQQNGGQTHAFKYPMTAVMNGFNCNAQPAFGKCNSPSDCPGVFYGQDATDGQVSQCSAYNAGITITFC